MPAGGLEPPRQLAADFKSEVTVESVILSIYYEDHAALMKFLDEIIPMKYTAP
jgi:hypothetical protein